MRRFIANLQEFEPEIDGEQIADLLWLAQHITIAAPSASDAAAEPASPEVIRTERLAPDSTLPEHLPSPPQAVSPPAAAVYTSESVEQVKSADSGAQLPVRAAATRALRRPMALERALRPLMRKVPSRSRYQLDEVATAERIAETGLPTTVKRAERERWLDVVLVVEETSLTEIWRKSIDEFQRLLEHLGAFRDVRVWTMRRRQVEPAAEGAVAEPEISELELFPRHQRRGGVGRLHSHQELIDPSQRRLILVLSDCTSVAWWAGKIHPWLRDWAAVNLVSVVQLLPERLWERGILGEALPVRLRAQTMGTPNHQWHLEGLPVWRSELPTSELTLPVVALEPTALEQWARAMAGFSEFPTAGVLFEAGWHQALVMPALPSERVAEVAEGVDQAEVAEQWVAQFRAEASPMARRLAVLMAAAPVDLAVVGLLQETLLPDSQQVHVAEVYLSGLMQRVGDLEKARFEFRPGVRRELRKSLPKSEARKVLDAVSDYVVPRLDGAPRQGFEAVLMAGVPEAAEGVLPFAQIALETLRQMGGNYAAFAEEVLLRRSVGSSVSELADSEEENLEQSSNQRDEDDYSDYLEAQEAAADVEERFAAYRNDMLRESLDDIKSKIFNTFIRTEYYFQDHSGTREIDAAILAEDSVSVEVLDFDETNFSDAVFVGPEPEATSLPESLFELSVKIDFSVDVQYLNSKTSFLNPGEVHSTLRKVFPNQTLQAIAVVGAVWDEVDFELVQSGEVDFELVELRVKEPIRIGRLATSDNLRSPWQTFEFEAVTVEVTPDVDLELFGFEMAILERQQTGILRRKSEWVIQRQRGQARQFSEQLTDEVALAMVAIPAGDFLMGSPANEAERGSDEGPQHRVTVPEFYLGKHPITQAQWRVVAGLPQIERKLDPDPSGFKGDDRPVEKVSWDDAVEFCGRLNRLSDREYRLPSEAEWEYACRSGTSTPFHFGETITPDLANYNGDFAYGSGPEGVHRREMTPIGTFPPNAFGLYDMHGNVWEWCADHWHDNYDGAPTDGSAWLSDEKAARRLLRGGSWDYYPRYCRSAVRFNDARGYRYFSFGFRVSCSAARILP
jgi:formylglycine-generating enzyme required for sulfatase activity